MSRAVAEADTFVVPRGKIDLYDFFNNECTPLTDPGIRISPDGDIYYEAWSVPRRGLAEEGYVIISPLEKKGDIFVAGPSLPKEIVIRRITGDDGSIETAIRAMEHILESTKERDLKFDTIQSGMSYIDDLFTRGFAAVSDEEFTAARIRTYDILERVRLVPSRIVNEQEHKMAELFLKASWGMDSVGRRNPLIAMCALSGAYRIAQEVYKGIPATTAKYLRMREALLFERDYTRQLLSFVASQFNDQSAFMNFIKGATSTKDQDTVKDQIYQLMDILDKPRVKTYRTVAQQVRDRIINEISDNTPLSHMSVVFSQERDRLNAELSEHEHI